MAYELKDNSGSLFTNDRKQKDTHPDYKGSLRINGREYWLSGWKKKGQSGAYLSLSVQEKEMRDTRKTSRETNPDNTSTGDVPF